MAIESELTTVVALLLLLCKQLLVDLEGGDVPLVRLHVKAMDKLLQIDIVVFAHLCQLEHK